MCGVHTLEWHGDGHGRAISDGEVPAEGKVECRSQDEHSVWRESQAALGVHENQTLLSGLPGGAGTQGHGNIRGHCYKHCSALVHNMTRLSLKLWVFQWLVLFSLALGSVTLQYCEPKNSLKPNF